MLEVTLTTVISFIVAFLAIPVVILIAERKKLFDLPDERKLHTHTIASLGGVGIFLGFVFASLLFINFQQFPEFQYIFAAAFLVFFTGLKDDIIALSAFKKLVTQIIAAAIIIHLADIRIESMYGIAGIYEISPMYGVPLSYITIILVINAYNLIDGVDGLAGSLGLLVTTLSGTYFYLSGYSAYSIFSFALAGSLAAFLIFNYNPAKIFMGDSGSLMIGLVASILVLKFINLASGLASPLYIESAVAIGISLLIIPLVDTLRVFTIRILKGRSPFTPDRNHVHHLLLDRGFNHSAVTLICVTANVLVVVASYLARGLGNTLLIAVLFGTAFSIMGVLYLTLPKRRKVIQRQIVASIQQRNNHVSKVINLNTKETVQVADKSKG
ncbi:MraY family glycosyltransferase [Niabella terrae]